MSLIRKKTLYQLKKVNDQVNKELDDFDIGEETSQDYPQELDIQSKDLDMDFDTFSDATGKLFGQWGMGQNVGGYYGDVTHDGEYANVLFCHNPLESKVIMPY